MDSETHNLKRTAQDRGGSEEPLAKRLSSVVDRDTNEQTGTVSVAIQVSGERTEETRENGETLVNEPFLTGSSGNNKRDEPEENLCVACRGMSQIFYF